MHQRKFETVNREEAGKVVGGMLVGWCGNDIIYWKKIPLPGNPVLDVVTNDAILGDDLGGLAGMPGGALGPMIIRRMLLTERNPIAL